MAKILELVINKLIMISEEPIKVMVSVFNINNRMMKFKKLFKQV